MSETGAPQARKAVTSTDVAREAGVSQSAVSRAFTPGASISEETRRRVLESAAKLGYRPNAIARTLIMGRSRLIGVAMAYFDNQFYPALLQELSGLLQGAGYHILLFTTRPGLPADPALDEVLRYRTDGLILASTDLSSSLANECRDAGVPVVLINRTTRGDHAASVTGDNEKGGECIARFLAAGGHRRFAYVAGLEGASTNQERERGFTRWLRRNGFDAPARRSGDYDVDKARAAARGLLNAPERPDAIFCANDHMALAVIDVVRHEFSLEPGKDISIVGFDDVGPAGWPSYSLTTYEQPIGAMAREAVDILGMLMENPAHKIRNVTVEGALIVRGSARVPPGVFERGGRRVWQP